MPFLGGFVFPHGAITLDPDTRDLTKVPAYRPGVTKEACLRLHAAMQSQAEALVKLAPDLIIMTTPHGLRLDKSFVLHGNSMSTGTAEWDGDWVNFRADISVDTDLSKKIVDNLRGKGQNVEMLAVGAPTNQKLPLNWGEVIPWWFISKAYEGVSRTPPKAIIIGVPAIYSRITENIPKAVAFGSDIHSFIKTEVANLRVAVVISGDLSHYHSSDPTSPYPPDPDAAKFDTLIEKWARTSIDKSQSEEGSESNTALLKDAGGLIDHVGTCGFGGLTVLQGVLTSSAKEDEGKFVANLLEYSWPTYYGMVVAHFVNDGL